MFHRVARLQFVRCNLRHLDSIQDRPNPDVGQGVHRFHDMSNTQFHLTKLMLYLKYDCFVLLANVHTPS